MDCIVLFLPDRNQSLDSFPKVNFVQNFTFRVTIDRFENLEKGFKLDTIYCSLSVQLMNQSIRPEGGPR